MLQWGSNSPGKLPMFYTAICIGVVILPWKLTYPLKDDGWKILKDPFKDGLLLGGHSFIFGKVTGRVWGPPCEDGWHFFGRLCFSAILFGVHPLCVQTVACPRVAGGRREATHPKKNDVFRGGWWIQIALIFTLFGEDSYFDSFYSRGWNHQLVEVGWSYLILLMAQKSQTTTWDV